MPSHYRLGVDIGGTFTDLVLVNEREEVVRVGKLLTTSREPAAAVDAGLQEMLTEAQVPAEALSAIVHGTTLATNALIERKGARTGLLTTRGFRDVVEIGREGRYDMYDIFIDAPSPLVPRHLRREVQERVGPDGTVTAPLDEADARAAIGGLLDDGVEAVAICLLHAYRDPTHERSLAALVEELAPELPVSYSSEIVPEIRELERASTTIANVYVKPLVSAYLTQLEQRLHELGVGAPLYVMLSSGGIALPEMAKRVPIRLVESGPAAGAIAAASVAAQMNEPRLLSFDMGGTTAKACVIDDGEPLVSQEFEVAREDRFKKGSGLPMRIPVIEMIEIGAGGGSIAHVDRMGLLKVGPESAGAEPGPACYGRGGDRPTVTDADLLLGYLDPEFFLGGKMRLDVDASRRAIQSSVSEPLGLDLIAGAWGIHRVVNENMAAAARIHGIERGKDLRSYPLFAFGGAGPVHAFHVARILRVPRLLVPFGAGASSALGLLRAPLKFDFVRTAPGELRQLDWSSINGLFEEMEAEGRKILADASVAEEAVTIERTAEMRYIGQGHEVEVSVPAGALSEGSCETLEAAFEAAYRTLYGRVADGVSIEALSWRVVASGPNPADAGFEGSGPPPKAAGKDIDERRNADVAASLKGHRRAYFGDEAGFVDTPVYDRYGLEAGARFDGPAIVEESESTVIVGPESRVTVDGRRTLIVELEN